MRQSDTASLHGHFSFEGTNVRDLLELGRKAQRRAISGLPRHRHDAQRLEIIFVERGRRTQNVNDRPYLLLPGEALMVLPGDCHSAGDLPEERGIRDYMIVKVPPKGSSFLNLRGTEAEELRRILLRPPHRKFALSASARQLFMTMLRVAGGRERLGDDDAMHALRLHTLCAAFLVEAGLCSRRNPRHDSTQWTANVLAFIAQRVSEPLRVADLARHAGMSVVGFKCRFKKAVGVPPARYVAQVKVEAAKERLLGSTDTVTEIAFALGFCSSQYFASFFRREVGLSPRDYRKRFGRTGGALSTRPPDGTKDMDQAGRKRLSCSSVFAGQASPARSTALTAGPTSWKASRSTCAATSPRRQWSTR
jgi:AraC-like DNA-binding protein